MDYIQLEPSLMKPPFQICYRNQKYEIVQDEHGVLFTLLNVTDLLQYWHAFNDAGLDSFNQLKHADPSHFIEILEYSGMSKKLHQRRFKDGFNHLIDRKGMFASMAYTGFLDRLEGGDVGLIRTACGEIGHIPIYSWCTRHRTVIDNYFDLAAQLVRQPQRDHPPEPLLLKEKALTAVATSILLDCSRSVEHTSTESVAKKVTIENAKAIIKSLFSDEKPTLRKRILPNKKPNAGKMVLESSFDDLQLPLPLKKRRRKNYGF